jgi:outer membrane lipoprotein SlyB
MKKVLTAVLAVVAAVSLSGCLSSWGDGDKVHQEMEKQRQEMNSK